MKKNSLRKIEPYVWIAPSLILMSVFILVPIVFVFRMALSDVSKAGLIKGFNGAANFAKVLKRWPWWRCPPSWASSWPWC